VSVRVGCVERSRMSSLELWVTFLYPTNDRIFARESSGGRMVLWVEGVVGVVRQDE
jgi:hypothetical protein